MFEPVSPAHTEGFLHHRWNGKCYPPFIDPAATAHLASSWDTQPNDVFIATHQKVGTHLAKKYLVELVRAGVALPADHPLAQGDIGHGAVPWPEVLLSQEGASHWQAFLAVTAAAPRLWYLHCALEDLPCRHVHPASRFVVVVRDPRAVVVSQYNFWRGHPLLAVDPGLDLERFTDLFLAGDLYFGDYFSHVRGWLESGSRLHPEQLCLMRYEDLVERKPASVDRLQAFLFPGVGLDPARWEAIAASTGFAAMKRDLSANPRTFHFNAATFFRSGTIDDWRRHLSAGAQARIAAACRQRWAGLERHPLLAAYLEAMAC